MTDRSNSVFGYVIKSKATTKPGSNPKYLLVRSNDDYMSYMTWSAPVPLGAIVHSAEVLIQNQRAFSGTVTCTLTPLTGTLDPGKLSYKTRPAAATSGSVTVSKTDPAADTTWTYDFTSLFQQVANGTVTWKGLRLTTTSGTTRYFHGKSKPPVLRISYSMPVPAPRVVSPTSGLSVSVAKPVLTIELPIGQTDSTVSSIKVQVSSTSDFTGAWDSGWLPYSGTEVDLAALPGAPAAAADDVAGKWFRMAVRTALGVESAWTTPEQYVYSPLGTLTVTAPGSTVGRPTYESSWSLSGRTQRYFQVMVLDPNSPVPLYDSGRIDDPDGVWSIPPGAVPSPSGNYQQLTRVWDTVRRIAVPGSPAWVQDVRPFTFTTNPGLAKPLSVSVYGVEPRPDVHIRFGLPPGATGVDITRDDLYVATDVPPEELTPVEGGLVEFVTTGDGKEHEWVVYAAHPSGTSDPEIRSLSMPQRFAWVSDPDSGLYIPFTGRDPISMNLSSSGALVDPIGAASPFRVNGTLKKYRGTLQGELCADCLPEGDERRPSDLRDQWMRIRDESNRGIPYRLTGSDFDSEVILYDVDIWSNFGPATGKTHGISAKWFVP